MDPIPAPGAVPAVANADKGPQLSAHPLLSSTGSAPKPTETGAESKPADGAKLGAPTVPGLGATSSDAPKPVAVEEVPDKDGPAAAPDALKPGSEPSPAAGAASTTKPAVESTEKPSAEDKADPAPVVAPVPSNDTVVDKPATVNGVATDKDKDKDVEMTGALKGSKTEESAAAPAPAAPLTGDSKPTGSSEREAAPQAVPPEEKASGPDVGGVADPNKKRKAEDVEPAAEDTNGAPAESEPATEKRKADRPAVAAKANGGGGGGEEKESLGQKVVKKAKKVLPPVGRTQRKTRSQGPA